MTVTVAQHDRPKKKCKYSLLDDFESGNTCLDDILNVPTSECNSKSLGAASGSLDFNDYLVKFALTRSTQMDAEYRLECTTEHTECHLDFGGVTKTTTDDEMESENDECSDSDLDVEVGRSSQYERSDERAVEANFGRDLSEFLDSSSRDGMALDEIFDRHGQEDEEREGNEEDEDEDDDYDEDDEDIADEDYGDRFDDLEFTSGAAPDDMDIEFSPFSSQYHDIHFSHRQDTLTIFQDDGYYRDNAPLPPKSPGRICEPVHRLSMHPAKSTIRVRRNLLNLIVESSDHNLDDATKYATEINSTNCTGIPLPEKVTELVTIPTTGPCDEDGQRKAAIVRATIAQGGPQSIYQVSLPSAKSEASRSGFYTAREKVQFIEKSQTQEDKENVRLVAKAKPTQPTRRVQWANALEW